MIVAQRRLIVCVPGPEDRQVSHLDPGHGVHVTCMHSMIRFEVRDL